MSIGATPTYLRDAEKPRTFVRIYRMPRNLTDGYCFGAGKAIIFTNVDWFEVIDEDGQDGLTAWIKGKKYYDPNARFLVIGDKPQFVYIIEKEKP
jgi:hypothetical protein